MVTCPPPHIRSLPLKRTRSAMMMRSEEHTSELQSRFDLVCRLLLEKKKENDKHDHNNQPEKKNEHCTALIAPDGRVLILLGQHGAAQHRAVGGLSILVWRLQCACEA